MSNKTRRNAPFGWSPLSERKKYGETSIFFDHPVFYDTLYCIGQEFPLKSLDKIREDEDDCINFIWKLKYIAMKHSKRVSTINNKSYTYPQLITLAYYGKHTSMKDVKKIRHDAMCRRMYSKMKQNKKQKEKLHHLNKIKHVKEDNMNYYNTSNDIVTKIKQRAEEKVTTYLLDSVKKKFGKEYYFTNNNDNIISAIVNDFLPKCNEKMTKYCQKNPSGTYSFINSEVLLHIDKATYIYVASGRMIPDISDKLFMDSGVSSQDIYMYIFGKKMVKYVKKFDKFIKSLYINNEIGIYTVTSGISEDDMSRKREGIDVVYQKMQLRDISTLFYSHDEKERVCEHIEKFNSNETFYKDRQILYKTGILLYGEPGTGKSSFVKALATKYNRSIVNINISSFPTLDVGSLTQSINIDEYKKYIILLEDIDTLFLNRETGESNREDMSVINKLLQFLDSNTSPTNVIFIATTNHKERLDEALLREGRFDLKVEMKGLNKETAREFCKSFGLSSHDTEDVITSLTKDMLTDISINQSKLQAHALAKIENKTVEKSVEIHGEMVE